MDFEEMYGENQNEDGFEVAMTKRERCLRYIIKRLEIMPMFALVDCGLS